MHKKAEMLNTIMKLYDQQLCMYVNNTHSVAYYIANIIQPFVHPFVRSKAKSPTELDFKLNLSIAEHGILFPISCV